jgi:hypothetical protein
MEVTMFVTNGRARALGGYLAVSVIVIAGVVLAPNQAQAHERNRVQPIPLSAFLQPADLGGVTPSQPDADLRPSLRPPKPGNDARYRSTALLRAEGAITALYPVADGPTVLLEYVAKYRGGGADRYVTEVRRALAGRQGRTDRDGQWTLLRTRVAGRDSLLIRLRERFEDPDRGPVVHDFYIVVARTGRVVVALTDLGWETGSGHQQLVLDLVPAALRRASSIR